jgi:hypothetical protein
VARRSQNQFIKTGNGIGLQLNIKNPKGALIPPPISAQAFNELGGFDPEIVVSRFLDGSVASRFKDPVWNIEAWRGSSSKASSKLIFPDDKDLANEVKTIIFLVLLTPAVYKLDASQIYAYVYLLKRLAAFCHTERLTLRKLLNTRKNNLLVALVKDEIPFLSRNLIVLSDYLFFMRIEEGFNHSFPSLTKNTSIRLRRIAEDYKLNTSQNPVIPSRILKAVYHDAISEYEALLPVLDELLGMQVEIDSHPMVGLALTSQKSYCSRFNGVSFSQLKKVYPTNYDLAKKYPQARDFLNSNFKSTNARAHDNGFTFDVLYDKNDVLGAINYIQRVCQDVIIMFTGMRPVEARLLPYFGSKKTIVDGVEYWLIYGFAVKKRTKNPPFEMWVTNEYGYRAFQTAKRIADLHYERNDRQPIEVMPDGELTPELSPLYLRDNGKIDQRFNTNMKTSVLSSSYTITKADFDELKMIDPHRVWEGEADFAVGKSFPVTLSLFRRSIAFFASASGVRLVDMKNQLHHLFDSQTFYYGNGSGRANPFLKDKDSFASYFNQVKHEAEAFSFINEVINFDGKLFGASATYAERNQVFYSTIHDEDRAETVKRFKRGELAYTETHLGGCKTLNPCKSKALGSVTACLSCKDADIRPAKLAHAIKDQAEFVDGRNPDRLEFRTEIQELIVMLDFAIKNIDKAMKGLDRRKDEYKQFSQWCKEFTQMRRRYLKKVENSERVA